MARSSPVSNQKSGRTRSPDRRVDFIHQIHWRPEIGDPTVMGWVTVFAYGTAAITAALAALRAGRKNPSGERRMWGLVSILMMLLCVNKQLDLQSLLTDIGRVVAWNQGWYSERRLFQKWFVLGVLGISGAASGFLAWRFRGFWKRHFLLAAGLGFLLTFIVVRAVSFHHVDVMLRMTFVGVRMNWILELGGIALVWAAAAKDLLRGS